MTEKKVSDGKDFKLRPLEDRLVVQAIDESETMVSGIIIPETVSKEKPQKGRVLAVGPGKVDNHGQRVPMEVEVGDVVLFTKYGPTEVKVDGEDYLVLNQSDVLAVVA